MLVQGLAPSSRRQVQSALTAFARFCLVDGVCTNLVERRGDTFGDMMAMRRDAESKAMGFLLFEVEVQGNTVDTGYGYAKAVLLATRKVTGIDPEFGGTFKDLTLLKQRLKVMYPHIPRVRWPLVQQDYLAMWKVLPMDTVEAKRFKAFTLLQFQAVCRFADLQMVKRSDVEVRDDMLCIGIRHHKTSHHACGQQFDTKYVALPHTRDALSVGLSAALAVLDYLKVDPSYASVPDNSQFLFRYSDGTHLKYARQLHALRSVLRAAGRDPDKYGLHSPRIGGATCAMVDSGGNEFIIRQMGFWGPKGDSVRLYTRPTPELVSAIQRRMMARPSTRLFSK